MLRTMLRCARRHVACLPLAVLGAACARFDEREASAHRSNAVTRPAALSTVRPEVHRALEALRREENELRARTDFATLPPSSRSLGSNPYALVTLEQASRATLFAGVLRGDSVVTLLDANAREVSREQTVLSPNALAALPDGRLFVVGDIEPRVALYRVVGSRLVADGDLAIPDARSLRAVAADERALFVADFWGDRVYSKSLASDGSEFLSQPLCDGPIRLALTERFIGAVCLFDHAIALFERGADGLVTREIKRITHDGPIWGFSISERGEDLLIAAGGVEDHPLDRRDKAFGYVDSFAYLYRLDAGRRVERLFSLNTSEHGLVTPKITELEVIGRRIVMKVLGYASDTWLEIVWNDGTWDEPRAPQLAAHSGLPGCSDAAFAFDGQRMLCANPLLDAWIAHSFGTSGSERMRVHPSRPTTPSDPSPVEKLGETLFFTTLMAPDATSAGKRSRFTCETCHFEGGTDGRVHHSGRGDVRVSTRPLLGLFNDAPHFSRAHDPDLTAVSNNEFAVANRGNPIDPWFALSKNRFPWLDKLGLAADSIDPLELRRALLVFLARFSHSENPLAVRRPEPRSFTDDERRGANLFRERCVRCHTARLVARDAMKEVPFERWESLILSPEGPIVWSNGDYAKTGVTPYVDPKGTQVPSLRRLYLKRPYLTNGSARTLEALLASVRFSGADFWHAASAQEADQGELDRDAQRSLLAFLTIL